MPLPIEFAERGDKHAIENERGFAPKFGEDGLIPVVTQDHASGEVLMVAYMNRDALHQTITIKEAVYYSRSRDQLWHKGATSGHVQKVTEMRTDCDQDVILLKVDQVGPGCCHVGYASCFYRKASLGEEFSATSDNSIAQLEFSEEKTYNPDEVYQ
ncbi:MAG: phosphoribosyl-AMP cyclohydrolase [Verrucomicrobiaceae bacterium]|nr:phosphoribosyl-AMP cyclohydrolase [Verrucomicrobiaceae bacterium]